MIIRAKLAFWQIFKLCSERTVVSLVNKYIIYCRYYTMRSILFNQLPFVASSCQWSIVKDVCRWSVWNPPPPSDDTDEHGTLKARFFCFSGRIPRLSLIRHSLYVNMLKWLRNTSPTTHRGTARRDGAEIPWRWSLPECFTLTLTSPFIFNNSVETAVPFNVINHPRCCEPRN